MSGRLAALERGLELLPALIALRAELAAPLGEEGEAGGAVAETQAVLVDETLAASDALRAFVAVSGEAVDAQLDLGAVLPQTTQAVEAQADTWERLGQAIRDMGPEYETLGEAAEQAGERAGDALGRAFDDLIVGGRSLDDVLKQLERDLLAILETSLFGPGGVGGFLGTALGGLFGGSSIAAAGGGLVRGPGSSSSDSIPARLSDGEFVVNAAANRANRSLLETINAGHPLRALANGGLASFRVAA